MIPNWAAIEPRAQRNAQPARSDGRSAGDPRLADELRLAGDRAGDERFLRIRGRRVDELELRRGRPAWAQKKEPRRSRSMKYCRTTFRSNTYFRNNESL